MSEVPRPEDCRDEESNYLRVIQDPKTPPAAVKLYQDMLQVCVNFSGGTQLIFNVFKERMRSPIYIKPASIHHIDKEGIIRYSYWMKVRDSPNYEPPFQKVCVTLSSNCCTC